MMMDNRDIHNNSVWANDDGNKSLPILSYLLAFAVIIAIPLFI